MKIFEKNAVKAKWLMEKIIDQCPFQTVSGMLPANLIDIYRKRGEALPDALLPGRYIMSLSKEKRELLSHLTSDMIQDRQDV